MTETDTPKTPWWIDGPLLAAERIARQIYWSLPWLRRWVKRRLANRPTKVQVAPREQLKEHLRQIGVTEGSLVMVHTSTTGLCLTEGPNPVQESSNVLRTAKQLLDDLLELAGESGTLVMPTHAAYHSQDDYTRMLDRSKPIHYDPAKTPSAVGLVNELFRRQPGVQRSLHPYNTLAARGPLAAELLRDNLNDRRPLPHGMDSGYYRLCQRDGLVVSIGVPLRRCLTLVHVAEDVRDSQWPIPDFFEERTYLVRMGGEERPCVVRQHRLEYPMFCLCLRKATRDLAQAGILHEGRVGGLRVDWARSREVLDFMMARNQRRPYPYYATWLAPRRRY